MIPTLSRPLRKIGVPTEQFQPWVNNELLPALREVQQVANYTAVAKATITTAGAATPTVLWSSQDIASGTAFLIEATITARSASNRSAFKVAGTFYSQGVVTQEGATATIYSQNAAGYAVALAVSSNHVDLTVTDPGGAIPFSWVAVIEAQEVA